MSTLRWICICVGAVSLFSVLERLTNFVLAPHVDNLLGLYRAFLYPFCERIIDYSQMALAAYHVHVPILPLDLVILYALIVAAVAHFTFNQRAKLGSVPVTILLMPLSLIWPVIMIGNIVALCVSPKLAISNLLFGWDIELAKVIATCLVMFGANFYLLA